MQPPDLNLSAPLPFFSPAPKKWILSISFASHGFVGTTCLQLELPQDCAFLKEFIQIGFLALHPHYHYSARHTVGPQKYFWSKYPKEPSWLPLPVVTYI